MRDKGYSLSRKQKEFNFRKFLIGMVLFALACIMYGVLKQQGFHSLWVQTDAMFPKIKPNSLVFFSTLAVKTLQKGDIVLIESQYNQTPVLCQIVALEGESIIIQNKKVFVDNVLVPQEELGLWIQDEVMLPTSLSSRDYTQIYEIPVDSFFCLNTNWENSYDSRTLRLFSEDNVRAKAIIKNLIFWL